MLVYTTQAEYLVDQRVTLFVTIFRQKPLFFSCSEVNSGTHTNEQLDYEFEELSADSCCAEI